MWCVWVGGTEHESRYMGLKEVSRSIVDVGG